MLPAAVAIAAQAAVTAAPTAAAAATAADRLDVRVVVLTTFPIESAPWQKGIGWTDEITFLNSGCEPPQPLFWDQNLQLLHCCIGMGPQRASASVTALGFDARLNLTKSFWILSGIAGVDPAAGSLAGANWASSIVDGDYAYYIDPREKGFPQNWETGVFPQISQVPTGPYDPYPVPKKLTNYNLWTLNTHLVEYAVAETINCTLPDSDGMRAEREKYADSYPVAAAKPSVFSAGSLAGARYWAGDRTLTWARNWTLYWTEGAVLFGTSAEEDSGVAVALNLLFKAGRARDYSDALLVLRSVSDYLVPPLCDSSNISEWFKSPSRLWAEAAAESAYITASRVARSLSANPNFGRR